MHKLVYLAVIKGNIFVNILLLEIFIVGRAVKRDPNVDLVIVRKYNEREITGY